MLSAASDEIDAAKGQQATAYEATERRGRSPFKISIKDRASDNDGDGEEYELRGYNLGGVEALQGTIDIADL